MNSITDLSCSFLGRTLDSPICNASGARCTTKDELDSLERSESAVVVTKSCTLQSREGNPSPRYQDLPLGSINSMGLPNLGIDFYLQYAKEVSYKKPIILSMASLRFEDNKLLLQKITQEKHPNIFAIELNLSCPNVIGKAQVAYDPDATKAILDFVFSLQSPTPIGIKLPPYFDFSHFDEMAKIFSNYPLAFITSINSIGNALYIDAEQESVVLKPKNGFGGLGGEYIKPTALANVRKWFEYFPHIPIIGCGGVTSGKDVFEHLLCGASLVQVGTLFMQEGIDIFSRLAQELEQFMQEKNYRHISDFKGKLKFIF